MCEDREPCGARSDACSVVIITRRHDLEKELQMMEPAAPPPDVPLPGGLLKPC
jgi:hypothetical protein